MTITALPVRDEYTATAGQTVFNYTFKIYTNQDLNVYITPSGQEPNDSTDITTDYTVDAATIGDEDGGFITLNSGTSAGDLVTIVSAITEDRTTDYQNSGDFLPDTVNTDFDKAYSLIKQAVDRAGRTLAFQESLQNATELSLPDPEAGRYLIWNGTETGVENAGAPSVIAPSEIDGTTLQLIAASDTVAGQYYQTTGYRTEGDGGGNIYLCQAVTGGADDGGSLIKSTGNLSVEFVGLFPQGIVTSRQFATVGDNVTDDTTAITNAITYASTNGCSLHFNTTDTHKITQITFADLTIQTNGCLFERDTNSTTDTPGVVVDNNVTFDEIKYNIGAGTQCRGVSVAGDNIVGQKIAVTSDDTQGVDGSDYGIRLSGNNIQIQNLEATNYDYPVVLSGTYISVGFIEIDTYVRGLHFDAPCNDIVVNGYMIHTASVNASYTAGHNGILFSGLASPSRIARVKLGPGVVRNAGEHGIRFGGEDTQTVSIDSPLVQNVGGSGIKLFGDGIDHKYITIDSPVVIDCGDTFENKVGYRLDNISECTITSPKCYKKDKTYSAAYGMLVDSCTQLTITDIDFHDVEFDGILMKEDIGANASVNFIGGYIRNPGRHGFYPFQNFSGAWSDIRLTNFVMENIPSNAANITPGGTKTDWFINMLCYNVTGNVINNGSTSIQVDLKGTDFDSLTVAKNGSIWQDADGGNFYALKAGTWTVL